MSIKQISVFLENKPGTLRKMTQVLADHSIDLRALSVAETKDFGIARLIVDDALAATSVLKDADFIASLTPVLAFEINDEKGGLNKL
ncbi:MAG: ACT domain-containing protein [Lachnospiraceae bacterium]|nr:ACT domain-containing protein [Lachnospiraceae bacterium]